MSMSTSLTSRAEILRSFAISLRIASLEADRLCQLSADHRLPIFAANLRQMSGAVRDMADVAR